MYVTLYIYVYIIFLYCTVLPLYVWVICIQILATYNIYIYIYIIYIICHSEFIRTLKGFRHQIRNFVRFVKVNDCNYPRSWLGIIYIYKIGSLCGKMICQLSSVQSRQCHSMNFRGWLTTAFMDCDNPQEAGVYLIPFTYHDWESIKGSSSHGAISNSLNPYKMGPPR